MTNQTKAVKASLGEKEENLNTFCVGVQTGCDGPLGEDATGRHDELPMNAVSARRLALDDIVDDGEEVPLHNASLPIFVREREHAHHRLFVLLKAQGFSNVEIAKRTGYSSRTVNDVLRQPYAREAVLRELRKNGRDEVLNIFQSNAADLAWNLVEIAKDENQKGSVRVSAIQSIHDRLLGKAVQPLTHQKLETKNLSDDEMLQYLESIKNQSADVKN